MTDASQAAQSATSSTEPTVAGEQRPPTLLEHAVDRSGEEQSTLTMPGAQLTNDNSPGAWGDHHELELPDYHETVYWEPDSDSDNGEFEVQKLSPTIAKLVEEAFSHSIPKREIKKPEKEAADSRDTPIQSAPNSTPPFNQGYRNRRRTLTDA